MTLRVQSITTLSSWLIPRVRTLTIPHWGLDLDAHTIALCKRHSVIGKSEPVHWRCSRK